ncbi:MAG: 16S rRNA (guanine(527)-N(7))-methyltransferase RsmG [Wenzhouxiangella sp.]|nr:16S rRNA (guanine(527)-N(7))-methyltransferase RsmG [Wenzhouxiangella sp.]
MALPQALDAQRGQLSAGLKELGLAATTGQQEQLLRFLALMQRWNRSYNLTAVTDPGQMVARHLLDSLVLLDHLKGARFLDAGTGPGLPGVPLAILRPADHFVLLDSNGKKIRFLNQVRRELKLDNIEPVQARLEDYQADPPPDAIVARALAPLQRLVVWADRWLDRGVPLLAMKGDLSESERRAVPAPYNVSLVELEVPGLRARRCLVTVEKR